MAEETDWNQTSLNGQRSYINARPHASGAVSEGTRGHTACAISRKVAGSIPDGVIGIFY